MYNSQFFLYYIVIFGIVLISVPTNESDFPKYQKCAPLDPNKLNVHVIPHSHMDAGWIYKFDEYCTGNYEEYSPIRINTTQIISNVIEALWSDPKLRFVLADIAFFWYWWKRHPSDQSDMRTKVQILVNEGRIEIANGGWVMNDEATTNYQAIIDQFTLGFRFLKETLGDCALPNVGWQIDPFGHSKEHAAILQDMGFEALILGRVDFRDKKLRLDQKRMEFYWNARDEEDKTKLFTSILPSSYAQDIQCISPTSEHFFCDNASILYIDLYRDKYLTNNLIFPAGKDFYFNDGDEFILINKAIEGSKNLTHVNFVYSTPSCYVQAVKHELKKKSLNLPKNDVDDFFPYADMPNAYWSGFYTSRPTLKRFVRVANAILQSAKQLVSFYRIEVDDLMIDLEYSIGKLRFAMSILQHHDAITGTSKNVVFYDYVRMLIEGIRNAEKSASVIIGYFMRKKMKSHKRVVTLTLRTCLLSNISICDVSTSKNRFYVAVYNPFSKTVSHHVSLPVNGTSFEISSATENLEYDVFDSISSFSYVKEKSEPAAKELTFRTSNTPAMGCELFYIKKLPSNTYDNYHPSMKLEKCTEDNFFGSKGFSGFTIDMEGRLSGIEIGKVHRNMTQEFLYYFCAQNPRFYSELRVSGAYIFAPSQNNPIPIKLMRVKCARGRLMDQVIQYYEHNITQIIRAYKNQDDPIIEFDWLLGDLKVQDKKGIDLGMEVITRYNISDFDNNKIFYTDSNGRQMIKRILNQGKEKDMKGRNVSSNYYPVTSEIFIRDEAQNMEFAVMTDRSQGGSSLCKGCIELMLHRSLLYDDQLGVNEVLNDTEYGRDVYTRGKHYVTLGSDMERFRKKFSLKKHLEPWILLGDATGEEFNTLERFEKNFNFNFRTLHNKFAENVHILTLEPWTDDYLLLRLENIFAKSNLNSNGVDVDLNNLFTFFNISNLVETYLGADRIKKKFEKVGKIHLRSLEIRTFLIHTCKANERNYSLREGEGSTMTSHANTIAASITLFNFMITYYVSQFLNI